MTESQSTFAEEMLHATAENALSALDSAGTRASELVEAWIKSANVAAVAEVAERGHGAPRKSARRGLNVLKSRGVTIPLRTRVATLAGDKQPEAVEAWLTPPDSVGDTLLVITSRAPASRYRAVFVVLNDALGVHRVDSLEVTHSQLRERIARVMPSAQCKPVKVPVEWVRHRIALARRRHAERGVIEPLGFTSAKSLLEPIPEQAPPHPFDEEGLELAPEDATELAKDSAKLHELPEFRGWFPARGAVDEVLRKVGETLTPGEQPEPEVLSQKLQAEIAAATDRYFAPERRTDLIRAMKDSALSVLNREGEQKALEVAATIACIAKCGLITDPPRELGFLKAFFEKAVLVLAAQGDGRLRIPVPVRPAAPSGDAASAEGAPSAESSPSGTDG
jgi:hypothetical protein